MKRLLYGTTALVAAGTLMAGPASAAGLEASLGGYMEQWFGFSDQDTDYSAGLVSPVGAGGPQRQSVGMLSDGEVHFQAVATLDNGLKVRYHVELEAESTGDNIDEQYLQLTASWGQINFGSENSASYLMAYGPNDFGITANSGDTNAWVQYPNAGGKGSPDFRTPFGSRNNEVDVSCNDANKLTYFTPRFSGFQFGVSYTPNCVNEDDGGGAATALDGTIHDVISLGLNFNQTFDQVGLKASVAYQFGEEGRGNPGSDPEALHAGLAVGFGGFTIGGNYNVYLDSIFTGAGTVDNEAEGWQAGVSYETGPWHFSVIWLHGEREGLIAIGAEDELDTVHLGLNYDLGPGVQLRGTLGWADYQDERGSAFDNDGWFLVGGMAVSF